MAEFEQISSGKEVSYPSKEFDGQEDQSYGFVGANKLQTGSTRGDQQIKGKLTVVDADGTVRLVLGYDPNKF